MSVLSISVVKWVLIGVGGVAVTLIAVSAVIVVVVYCCSRCRSRRGE